MPDNYIPNQLQNTGLYVQQTPIFDVQAIYETEVTDPAFKELMVRMYQQMNNVILSLNEKETAMYRLEIFQTGQNWFPLVPATTSNYMINQDDRPAFRVVINYGPLPAVAGVPFPIPHGLTITTTTKFTRIYGAATDPVNLLGIPLPYASPVLANNIELSVNQTNVIITTGLNRSAFTECYIVIEYLET